MIAAWFYIIESLFYLIELAVLWNVWKLTSLEVEWRESCYHNSMCQISQSTLTESQSPTTPDHSFKKWIERFKISWADALTWELVAYKTVKALRGKKKKLVFTSVVFYLIVLPAGMKKTPKIRQNTTRLCFAENFAI